MNPDRLFQPDLINSILVFHTFAIVKKVVITLIPSSKISPVLHLSQNRSPGTEYEYKWGRRGEIMEKGTKK